MKSNFSHFDKACMEVALKMGRKAMNPSPNPRVGAILVRGSEILAMGYHRGVGASHAEADVFEKAANRLQSNPKNLPLTLYVTLEPCCHFKKRTPPCTEAILRHKIQRVVVGCLDPNPAVNGRGIEELQKQGVQVDIGCLKEDCIELIRYYWNWRNKKVPYIALKAAISLDGKVALNSGESQWITGIEARKRAHSLRGEVDSILIGSQTALKDNPELTVRFIIGKNPLRVVLDSQLRLPLHLKLWENQEKCPTLIVTLEAQRENPQVSLFQAKGVQIAFCRPDTTSGKIDLHCLLEELGQRGIQSLMVEGGAKLASSFIEAQLIQEMWLFMAPKFLGGEAVSLFEHYALKHLADAPAWSFKEIKKFGEDRWIYLVPQKK